MVRSQDALDYADDENECRTRCNDMHSFNCNSYSYVNNQCALSGEWYPSPPSVVEPSEQQNAIFAYRTCVYDECRGLASYERVTGFSLAANGVPLVNATAGSSQSLLTCMAACNAAHDCLAFVIDRESDQCLKLDRNSQGRSKVFVREPKVSYFERVCLRLHDDAVRQCANKTWSFLRVVGAQLPAHLYTKSIEHVQSRRDCEELCLNERGFHCLSALYNEETIRCMLSNKRRSSNANLLASDNFKISYLESQCAARISEDEKCMFVEEPGAKNIHVDGAFESVSLAQCSELCDNSPHFQCASYSYARVSQKCLLSSVNAQSHLQDYLELSSNYSYFDKNCTNEILQPTERSDGDGEGDGESNSTTTTTEGHTHALSILESRMLSND